MFVDKWNNSSMEWLKVLKFIVLFKFFCFLIWLKVDILMMVYMKIIKNRSVLMFKRVGKEMMSVISSW